MATPAIETKPLMAEDMYAMPRDGRKYELVKGELTVSPAGAEHEGIGSELLFLIRLHLGQRALGRVFGSSMGYVLPSGDLLSPDVSYVDPVKLTGSKLPKTFMQHAPDLAVEIVSPSDSMTAVEQKVELYLHSGTQLVWVINPDLRHATVHRSNGTIAVVRSDGSLDGESVLPGFTCTLTEIL